MIGILCSNGEEKEYSKKLHSMLKRVKQEKNIPIVVFTVPDMNLTRKMVSGILISEHNIRTVKTPLPPVIFNFSQQRRWGDIRKVRSLAGIGGITLVNDINRFDQLMIMEMLSSSRSAGKYLLPYYKYDKAKRDFKPLDDRSYLIMPSRGSSMSRVIYVRPLINNGLDTGSQYFHEGHILDYIDASLCQKRWIFMEIPEILTCENQPAIIRVYTQRGRGWPWAVLTERVYPMARDLNDVVKQRMEKASMEIMNHLTRFMPGIGNCFIDFILDAHGMPYFLHFGGFDGDILDFMNEDNLYQSFYENLVGMAAHLGRVQGGD